MNNAGKISPLAAAEAAKALGVKIYTIASVFAAKRPFLSRINFGNTQLVMAKVDVDEKTLQSIAALTGGAFYRATDTDSLKNIYEQINRLEKTAQVAHQFEHYEELYRWALFPALRCSGSAWAGTHAIPEAPMIFAHPGWLLAGLVGLRRPALDLAPLRCAPARGARRDSSPRTWARSSRSMSTGRRRLKRGLFAGIDCISVRLARRAAGRLSAGSRSSGAATTSSSPSTLRAAC